MKEMLLQPDKLAFEKAMHTEVQSLFDMGVWTKVTRKHMHDHFDELESNPDVPPVKRKQIMTVWSFKRKRHPDGTLNKYKARLCCHGGQQQWGVNFWETYSPVVSWLAVCTMFTLSQLHKLKTKSIDFVLAYPQANIKTPIFLHTPQGVYIGPYILMLKKNLYGLKDAGRT